MRSRVDEGGETGLLGLALHPAFETNRLLYVYLSTDDDNRIVRMTYDGTARKARADPHRHRDLDPPQRWRPGLRPGRAALRRHRRCRELGQRPGHRLGRRQGAPDDRRGQRPRREPVRQPDLELRPPQRRRAALRQFGFDDTGRLWISEFGDKGADELNLIRPGKNYGWPDVEGSDGKGGYADPLAEWPVDQCSPSGIAIAAGRAWLGALQGECVWSVVLDGADAGKTAQHFAGEYGRIRSVALAPDGSLWVTTSNRDGRTDPRAGDDRILRVTL